MCPVPSDPRSSRRVAGIIADHDRRIRGLSTTPQLGNSSFVGSIDEEDGDGNLVSIIGAQDDGSHTVVSVTGPVPPIPSAPTTEGFPEAASIIWDGVFLNEKGVPDVQVVSTWDFSHVDVHISTVSGFVPSRETRIGAIREGGSQRLSVSLEAGTYYVCLVSMSRAGKISDPSDEATVVALVSPDGDAISQAIADVETTANNAISTANAANTAAGAAQSAATAAQSDADTALNDALAAAGLANTAQAKAELVEDRAISRGTDLVTNGTGMLGTNYNFTGFDLNVTDAPTGAEASFDTQGTLSSVKRSDEFMPVDVNRQYLLRASVKQRVAGTVSKFYIGLAPYDASGLSIQPSSYYYISGSTTTLAAPLVSGATTVQITSAANWADTNAYVAFWDYIDANGKTWPVHTYTRNVSKILSGSGVGTTVTLQAAYNGPNLPAGHPVSCNRSGGSYMYTAASNQTALEQWTTYSGTVLSGVHDGSTGAATNKFPPGTASATLLFLTDRDIPTGKTSKQSFASISFADATAAQAAANTAQSAATDAATAASDASTAAGTAQTTANAANTAANTAQTAANNAQTTATNAATLAGTKGRVIFQSTAPTGDVKNLWIRSSDNIPHTWSGSAWVARTDQTAINAAAAALAAQNAANAAQTKANSAFNDAQSALTNAGLAMDAASERTRIVFLQDTPAGTGWDVGDVWYKRVNMTSPVTAWYVWDGDSWEEQQLDETFLPLVNIGAGTYGSLSGTRLEAKTVTADKVLIGFGNLLTDPDFEDIAGWGISQGVVHGGTGHTVGSNSLLIVGSANQTGHYYGITDIQAKTPKVVEGTPYHVSAWVKAIGGGTLVANGAAIFVRCYDQAGNFIFASPTTTNAAAAATDTWVKIEGNVHIPAGYERAVVGLYSQAAQTSSIYFSNPTMREAANGSLIVDGAIDGKTITGAFFRTTTVGNRGIKINENFDNSIRMFDPVTGALTFHADGDTGTVLLTSASNEGQVTELSGLGMRVLNTDGSVSTQLGTFGDDFLNVSNALGESLAGIASDGVIAGKGLNIEQDPTLMGLPLFGDFGPWESPSQASHNGWLDQLPRGVVARGFNNVQGRSVTGGYMELCEIGFDMVPGRLYRIHLEPIGVYTANSYCYTFVGQTLDGSRPTQANHQQSRRFAMRNNHANSLMLPVGFTMYHYNTDPVAMEGGGGVKRCRLLIWLQTPDAGGSLTIFNSNDGGTCRIVVEDIGPLLEDTLIDRTGKSGTAEPPPEPDERSYTKVYNAINSRTYRQNGTHYNFNTSKMYQGQQPGTGNGDLQSIATFPNMTGDLSGATITSVRAYFYFEHWYYNSGGTAKIALHRESSLPSTQPNIYQAVSSSNWPKPGGRWVNIPKSFWAEIKSGYYKGLALGEPSMGITGYGIARGNPKLEIKYKK